jgi:hypothetical protein
MRPWLSRILTCSACIIAWTATTRPADADAAPVRVHLAYHAVAGCPDAAAFQRAVALRAPEVRFADDDGATSSASWVVTVTRLDAGAKGELSLDGGATVRTIEGESCASVVTALSVVAALGAREAAAEQASRPPPIREPTTPPPAEQAPLPPPPAPHWRPAFGIAWLVQSSRGALGPSLLVGLERETTNTAVAPSLRLYGARLVDAIPDRSFGWWLVGLQGCALRIGLSSALTAHLPCLDVEGGSLASSGFSSDRSRPWLAAGVSARVGLSLTRALRLEATGTALVPVTRDTFLSRPNEEAYRADVLLLRLAGGATLTLP